MNGRLDEIIGIRPWTLGGQSQIVERNPVGTGAKGGGRCKYISPGIQGGKIQGLVRGGIQGICNY